MGLIECASQVSVWRGYDYYNNKKVKNLAKIGDGSFTANVYGTASEPYTVNINVSHPRKSTCNCPHANGTRIVCKHMVATYFSAYPDEAVKFYQESLKIQEDIEQYEIELYEKIQSFVCHMKKSELQKTLLELLLNGDEWQLKRFLRDNDLY